MNQNARLRFRFEIWLRDNPPPDPQELVARAGRQYAASLGETYGRCGVEIELHASSSQNRRYGVWSCWVAAAAMRSMSPVEVMITTGTCGSQVELVLRQKMRK